MNTKGFSAKELLIVNIIIIGLAIGSIPLYYHLRNLSRENTFIETKKMIEGGLSSLKIKQVLIDNITENQITLDTNPIQATCTQCFVNVIEKAVSDPLWYKENDTTYYYSTNGNSGSDRSFYSEEGDYRLSYDSDSKSIDIKQIE